MFVFNSAVNAATIMYMECPGLDLFVAGTHDKKVGDYIVHDVYQSIVNKGGHALFFEYDKAHQKISFDKTLKYPMGLNHPVSPILIQGYQNYWISDHKDTYQDVDLNDKGPVELGYNAEIKNILEVGYCPRYIRYPHNRAWTGSESELYSVYNPFFSEFTYDGSWQLFEEIGNIYEYGSKDGMVLSGKADGSNISRIYGNEWIIYTYKYEGRKILVAEAYDTSGKHYYFNFNAGFIKNKDRYQKLLLPFVEGYMRKYYKSSLSKVDWDDIYDMLELSDLAEDIYLYKNVEENKWNYWKVSQIRDSLNVFVSDYCSNPGSCPDFEVIASGGEHGLNNERYNTYYSSKIEDALKEWAGSSDDENSIISKNSKLFQYLNYISDSAYKKVRDNFIADFSESNTYYFGDAYTEHDFLDDLQETYKLMKFVDEEKQNMASYKNHWTGGTASTLEDEARTYVLQKLFGAFKKSSSFKEENFFNDIFNADGFKFISSDSADTFQISLWFNTHVLVPVTEDFIKNKLGEEAPIFDYLNDRENDLFKKDIQDFTNAIAYFDYFADQTRLTEEEKEELSELNRNMKEFAKKYNVYPNLTTCSDLIGKKLEEKILSYFNIVRIAVPILLIGLGIVDFIKAAFAGDEGDMRKAQSKFIKRILIAVLFFFVPLIVKLLLDIANRVWVIISPDTCIDFS